MPKEYKFGPISFRLDPDAIKEEALNMVPWPVGTIAREMYHNPDGSIVETAKQVGRETPIIGSILAGEPTDALKEAILMGMPVKAKKGYVTMPNGKKIKLDKEVVIDQAKTDKYKDILDKAYEREWAGAEYEGPGYSTYGAYEDVPLFGTEGKYPLTSKDFETLNAGYRREMPSARDLNRDFKDVLDEYVGNGDIDRATANEWYSEYKVDPGNYTAKDAKAYNDMIKDIANGNVYYENLYNKQDKFGIEVTNYWDNDKRTKRWKDYMKLQDKYPDAYFNSEQIGTGNISFNEDAKLTQSYINQALNDLDAFRKKYGAPDESNLKSAYDFANKVIESRIREPIYEGYGSAWLGDKLDLSPGELKVTRPSTKSYYNNPYYKLLEESGEYAVTPKDFNKIVDNARLDNIMAAHRQAIQRYANDVKSGLMELNDLTPQQKLNYNKQITNILEPIINDNKLSIEQKKALITKEMNGLAEEIRIQREFN